jgi:hypothetical protein
MAAGYHGLLILANRNSQRWQVSMRRNISAVFGAAENKLGCSIVDSMTAAATDRLALCIPLQ